MANINELFPAWHNSAENRHRFGADAEHEFEKWYRCCRTAHCADNMLMRTGHIKAGHPDFSCDYCGQLIDVKNAKKQNNIVNISQRPFESYGEDTILAVLTRDGWKGQYRRNALAINNEVHRPAHYENATSYYRIGLGNFVELERLSLTRVFFPNY